MLRFAGATLVSNLQGLSPSKTILFLIDIFLVQAFRVKLCWVWNVRVREVELPLCFPGMSSLGVSPSFAETPILRSCV